MQLEFTENQVIVWVIESPGVFRRYVEELLAQLEGGEGDFVLSESENTMDIRQKLEVILTPYAVDLNEKRCISKVYAELRDLAYDELHYSETQSVLGQVGKYIMELEQDCSVNLSYTEPDLNQLFKAFGIRIEDNERELLTVLTQYLQIAGRLLGRKILIFVNLSFYLEKSEIEELLQEAFYLKLFPVLIEQEEIHFSVNTKCYIIDRDSCEIF